MVVDTDVTRLITQADYQLVYVQTKEDDADLYLFEYGLNISVIRELEDSNGVIVYSDSFRELAYKVSGGSYIVFSGMSVELSWALHFGCNLKEREDEEE